MKSKKTTSPFKDWLDFEKEIRDFANKYKTTVVTQAKHTSQYFEMSCFNYIVKFYELNGFELNVANLQTGRYRYKCTPSGIQSNFSHFEATFDLAGKKINFEIQHNLAVQSSHDINIFTTPDISIINSGKVQYTKNYYDTKTTFSFVQNKDLMSFCEVKQFTPFPEFSEAEKVYRDDLQTWRKNGWALIGLYNALNVQKNAKEATNIKGKFDRAWQYADKIITSSSPL